MNNYVVKETSKGYDRYIAKPTIITLFTRQVESALHFTSEDDAQSMIDKYTCIYPFNKEKMEVIPV